MKAIILAAGRGSRMKGLTQDRPKCLNTLAGRPLLEWQLEMLQNAGCNDLTIIKGYKTELLQGDYNTLENPHWETTNMVSTLAAADSLLSKEECLVSYSDIVVKSSHIRKLIEADWLPEAEIAITYDELWLDLWSLRNENPLEDAETFQTADGYLKTIGAQPTSLSEVQGQYMGLLKFKPSGWKVLQDLRSNLDKESRDKLDMTTTLNMLLEHDCKIQGVPLKGGWVEVDNQKDLNCYSEKIIKSDKTGTPWTHDWRNK
jgi:choline kinase